MKVRTLAVVIIMALPLMRAVCAVLTNSGLTDGPVIRIDDVGRFYTVYDAAGSRPTAEQLQRDYLDVGSDGLHIFAKIRNITGARTWQRPWRKHQRSIQTRSGVRRFCQPCENASA